MAKDFGRSERGRATLEGAADFKTKEHKIERELNQAYARQGRQSFYCGRGVRQTEHMDCCVLAMSSKSGQR
jgi:hypothetical protein